MTPIWNSDLMDQWGERQQWILGYLHLQGVTGLWFDQIMRVADPVIFGLR